MTQDRSPDRAERALTRAFEERAAEPDFPELDPAHLTTQALGDRTARPRRSKRRPSAGLVAAVVALALVIPLAATLPQLFSTRSDAPAEGPVAAPAAAPADAPHAPGGAAAERSGAGASTVPGWRWESMLDVAVLIPDTWGYDVAPGPDWCAGSGYQRPDAPFVDRNPLSRAVAAILCTGPFPDDLRQTHLTWRPFQAGDAAGTVALGSGHWLRVNRGVGQAFLSVEVPAADLALAEQILDTAHVVAADPRGCPVSAPSGSPTEGGLAGFEPLVSAATICQYVVDPTRPGPSLVGSYDLDQGAARSLARDIVAAPPIADAVGELTTCAQGEVMLVRFVGDFDGARSVRLVTGAGCGPFGLDDGVQVRRPSRATCADLITGPLWQAAFDARTAPSCAPR